MSDEIYSKKIKLGIIGSGARGTYLMSTALDFPFVEVPAICDTNADMAKNAQNIVYQKTGNTPDIYTKGEDDWKNLVSRDDLDAIIIATPWEYHTEMAIASMKSGKYTGLEVPACQTIKECKDLIKTYKETGIPCMMLENVNYFRNTLAMTRLIREGMLGEIQHAEIGYQHDCKFLAFTADGQLTWRGRHMAEENGNLYPTHPIGPTAWWMNINRGNRILRLSSISTKSRSLKEYAISKFGADHPLSKREYALGDVNTTLIELTNGMTITLYFDLCSPRPYDMIFRVQGTKGIYEGTHNRIHLDGISKQDEWEDFAAKYQDKYEHPIWQKLGKKAEENGGHGGCDYIVMNEFLQAAANKSETPQDVYDAVTWSAIVPLSIESVAKHDWADFPDFTDGKWKTNTPYPK